MDDIEINRQSNNKSGWRKALVFLLIVGLCFFLGNMMLVLSAFAGGLSFKDGMDVFGGLSDPQLKPYIKIGIGLNHLMMFTGAALLFVYWLKGKDWKDYFHVKEVDITLLGSFILLLLCAYPLIGASAAVFEGVEWAQQIDETSIEALMSMLDMNGVGDLLVNLVIVALLPAIGEELLFRGIIQKELVDKISNHHVAIILASIIFSGIHFQIQGFLPKFFIGLILGYAYYWTKSIWYPMILHFFNNGMQTLMLFFAGDKIVTVEEDAIQPEIWHLVIGVIFSCFLCYLIITNILSHINEKRKENV